MLLNCLAVAAGGAIGAVCRYLLGLIPVKSICPFPIVTLFINVAGAFIIGIIAAAACKNASVDPKIILFLKVGICGGFTTFSTFSLETFNLFGEGKYIMAIIYVLLSVVLCLLAVWGGNALINSIK